MELYERIRNTRDQTAKLIRELSVRHRMTCTIPPESEEIVQLSFSYFFNHNEESLVQLVKKIEELEQENFNLSALLAHLDSR
jgi:hypothetical protein